MLCVNSISLFSAILLSILDCVHGSSISSDLLHCYRGNEIQEWTGGSTLDLLINLISKVEDGFPTSLDIRQLSNAIVHQMRIDGIERARGVAETEHVTPFRAVGIGSAKLTLIRQLVPPASGRVPFEQVLTPAEVCALHRLVSTSIEQHERGDEARVCPAVPNSGATQPPNRRRPAGQVPLSIISRCPIERGTIRLAGAQSGSLTPGTIITSIAAALQPQAVRLSDFIASLQSSDGDTEERYAHLETMGMTNMRRSVERLSRSQATVDNVWAAGLSGDLAEMCLHQGARGQIHVGATGRWNDTLMPRTRYLVDDNVRSRWHATDAELIGGIDALIIADRVENWIGQINRMRLSQVLELFYSKRGVPALSIQSGVAASRWAFGPAAPARRTVFDEAPHLTGRTDRIRLDTFGETTRACDRKRYLTAIDVERLRDETFHMAELLRLTAITDATISDELLRLQCDTAVNGFMERATNLVDRVTSDGCAMTDIKPRIDLLIVVDGGRTFYDTERLIAALMEMTDVTPRGSFLSVVHGGSGSPLVNRTASQADVFLQIRERLPATLMATTFKLGASLATVAEMLHAQSLRDSQERNLVALTPVAVIFSQGERLAQVDFSSAQRLLSGTLLAFPDLRIIFVTNDEATFLELAAGRATVISTSDRSAESLVPLIRQAVSNIPLRILPAPCVTQIRVAGSPLPHYDETELYVTPSQDLRLRIAPEYLMRSSDSALSVQFQGVGYGDLTVCIHRNAASDPGTVCTALADNDDVWFNLTQSCAPDLNADHCQPIYFTVQLDATSVRCSESDCRFPDQVRLVLRHYGLDCVNENGRGNGGADTFNFSVFPVMALVLVLIIENITR